MKISFILMLIVSVILISGLVLMGIGGRVRAKYSNKLMVARVIAQAVAIIVVVLLYRTKTQSNREITLSNEIFLQESV